MNDHLVPLLEAVRSRFLSVRLERCGALIREAIEARLLQRLQPSGVLVITGMGQDVLSAREAT